MLLLLQQRRTLLMQQAVQPAAAEVALTNWQLDLKERIPDPGRWAAARRLAAVGGDGLPDRGCPPQWRSWWGWRMLGLACGV